MNEFTHFNEQGRAKMVDISEKEASVRTAAAVSSVSMNREVHEKIKNREIGKGDVLAVAQVAGIMAAKQTSAIIPMCHPIALKGVDIAFCWEKKEQKRILHIQSNVKTKGSTGVEMEALTSASVCALTVYDMCKAADKGMVIGPTFLLEKTGGKNGDYKREKADVDMED
ncbi:cyclic pyranopterin monophosphate synthase MoaC [Bacillus licheniformis]|uniref:cyclic pyranopterin monophosphate synthase MoaC n=1 Tax=Bacillus licheniformis TaxID=1402 RepID=UPI0011A28FE2|nr:cyclic pyranopterin monophosphate synthase MoaC [Bacillus licheniformis]TWL86746.1 Cyclic pyranopterin monophosphate synthase [Bacillus licheniformis]